MNALYDTIGTGYREHRRPDPRIGAQIQDALDGAERIVNVGAGAGSYEPAGRVAAAVEPSWRMIAQRPPGLAPCLRGVAEALPFADNSFDAAMAVLSLHHWPDQTAGLKELARVAPLAVILTWEEPGEPFWLTRDYFPAILAHDRTAFTRAPFEAVFRDIEVRTVPIPQDCRDGFLCAYWQRPQAYLDAGVRRAISSFSYLGDVSQTLAQLARDLDDGSWAAKNSHLLKRTELDLGYRIVIGRN